MPREGRRERREERRRQREERKNGRKELIRLALDLYEDGDDVDDLRDKVVEALESRGSGKWLEFMTMLFEKLLPLLMKLLTGLTG